MPNRNIVVVGASAGGVEALQELVRNLPGDMEASIFLVLHSIAGSPNMLPVILARQSALAVLAAEDRREVRPGELVVAPPDYHLVVEPGFVGLKHGPKQNRHRPSIDILFRSAAISYGEQVIGVVLTGLCDDGTAGLVEIRKRGGLAIVQEPSDALFSSMPENAIMAAGPD